ncbi:MAG TPA: CBS domain-containing protein [Salinivirgaceae bacterium]|nr:CBS domain-containing protein [Salinivirgaceae bacterium]HQA75953.1 CBS domain-containing protein [Salinivirgaceae bacterium]
MLAHEMMSDVVPSLKPSDSAYRSLNWMNVFKLSHLPVVNNGVFLGLLSDEIIYDTGIFDEPIEKISDRFINISISEYTHIFEIIDICSKYSLTAIPVVSDNKEYLGIIVLPKLIENISKIINANVIGGIIVVEVHVNDYSLSQIAQIVEGNDAKILSMYVVSQPDSMRLAITIKLNTSELTSIIRTFERYEYDIKATFEEKDTMKEIIRERYNSLMSYLNT